MLPGRARKGFFSVASDLWHGWLPGGSAKFLLAALCCCPLGLAQASERAGIQDEHVRRIVASTNGPSVRMISASTGAAERAQDLKLRRKASTAKRAAVKLTPAQPSAELKLVQDLKVETPKTETPVPQIAAKQPAKQTVTAKKPVAKRVAAKPAPKVIPVVKYETIKKTAATEVDVFSDPFGDESEVSLKPAKVKEGMTVRQPQKAVHAVVDNVDPFGDDEPIERLVQQPNGARGANQDNQIPSFEENLAQGPQAKLAPCPSPDELKKIREIKADIVSKSTDLPPECTLGDAVYQPRQFAATTYHWKASALCHKPLYFEDVSLERYGHSWGPILQPLVSGGKFFLTLPILPYEMGIEPPCECVYVLGYYRPGSCAPYMIFPVPLSIRGGLVEAGAVVGAVFLIP